MRSRGRPPKFGRPAALLALTLPQDVIEYLQGVDPDLGWAIVKLADRRRGDTERAASEAENPPDVSLVPIGPRHFLIVVRAHEAFSTLPGVDLVPLGHGRAFLAFALHHTIESLELALVDRLDSGALPPEHREPLAALREVLRSWRQDASIVFHERSIVVVERPVRPSRGPGAR